MSAPVRAWLGPAIIIASAASALLLAGCAKPNAASEANFARALEPVVADVFCRDLQLQLMTTADQGATPPPFPLMVPAKPMPGSRYAAPDADGRAMLEQGMREGMLTRTTVSAPARPVDMMVPLISTKLIVYTPTSAGAAAFRAVQHEAADHRMHSYPAGCLGRGHVDKVERWTEPSDAFGRTITTVSYRYSDTDLPASTPAAIRSKLTQPVEATTTLIQTNDGWQPAR